MICYKELVYVWDWLVVSSLQRNFAWQFYSLSREDRFVDIMSWAPSLNEYIQVDKVIRGVIDLPIPEEELALPVAEWYPLKRSTKPKLVEDNVYLPSAAVKIFKKG